MNRYRITTSLLLASALVAAAQPPSLVNGNGVGVNPVPFKTVLGLNNVANELQYSAANPPAWGDVTGKPAGTEGQVLTWSSGAWVAAEAATVRGVLVSKSDGTRVPFFPASDTDAARGVALSGAMALAKVEGLAGRPVAVDAYPANFDVAETPTTVIAVSTHYQVYSRMTIRLNGARLYHQVSFNATTFFGADAADDWSILGPGLIDGTVASPVAPVASHEIGINCRTSRRYWIDGVVVRYMKTAGFQSNSSNYGSGFSPSYSDYGGLKISTGKITNCNFDINAVGMQNYSSSEYIAFSGCTFNRNYRLADINAGNTKFSNCEGSGNTTFGVTIRRTALANDEHGSWIGGFITHNGGYAIQMEASALDSTGNVSSSGFQFVGVTFGADSTSTNKIESLGAGLTLSSCFLQSPVFASNTPSGMNTIQNCFIGGTPGAADDLTSISDLSAAERAKWRFVGNYTQAGEWAQNDRATLYAELASDQVFQSDDVLRDVTGLTLTLTPGRYKIEGFCLATPASNASGIKLSLNATGGGTFSGMVLAWQNQNLLTNGAGYYADQSITALADTRTYNAGGNGQPMMHTVKGVMEVTTTTVVKYQIAQQTIAAVNMTAESGSSLTAERINP